MQNLLDLAKAAQVQARDLLGQSVEIQDGGAEMRPELSGDPGDLQSEHSNTDEESDGIEVLFEVREEMADEEDMPVY